MTGPRLGGGTFVAQLLAMQPNESMVLPWPETNQDSWRHSRQSLVHYVRCTYKRGYATRAIRDGLAIKCLPGRPSSRHSIRESAEYRACGQLEIGKALIWPWRQSSYRDFREAVGTRLRIDFQDRKFALRCLAPGLRVTRVA